MNENFSLQWQEKIVRMINIDSFFLGIFPLYMNVNVKNLFEG